jgi:hypothetical protein
VTGETPLAGIWPDFPPRRLTQRSDIRPAEGFVLGGHARAPLLVGLLADRPGNYALRGVEVEYRVRVAGRLGPTFRRTIETLMSVCLQRTPVGRGRSNCNPPDLST